MEIKCHLDATDDFYCRSYFLLNMFRAPLCPSSGAREYYTSVCCLSYLVLGFQVVMCPVCGLLQRPANRTRRCTVKITSNLDFLCFNAARKQANFTTLRIKVRRIATASCDTAKTDALQVTSTTDLNPPRNNSVWIGLKEAGRPHSCTADFMRRFSNQIVHDVTCIFVVLCSRPI